MRDDSGRGKSARKPASFWARRLPCRGEGEASRHMFPSSCCYFQPRQRAKSMTWADTIPGMVIQEAAAIICRLEQCPGAMAMESTYRGELERVIAELMDATFRATDATEKQVLA